MKEIPRIPAKHMVYICQYNWVWWAGYVPFHPTIYGSFMCLWRRDTCQDHISERPSSIPCTE